ncbi:hypothetical protein [Nocardia cyriacigeorgica]
MGEAGQEMLARSTEFQTYIDSTTTHIRDAGSHWSGDAYWAAYDRILGDRDNGNKVKQEVDILAGVMINGATTLTGYRQVLLDKVATAVEDGFAVSDNWTVEAPTGSEPRETDRTDHQSAITTALNELLGQQSTIDTAIADAANEVRARGNALGEGDAVDAPGTDPANVPLGQPQAPGSKYKIGPPEKPELPHDDTFEYDSKRPGLGDYVDAAEWRAKLEAGELVRTDLDDATSMYRHYWENNGEPIEFDYDEAYREDSVIRGAVDTEITQAAAAADQFVRDGQTNFQMTGGPMNIGQDTPYPDTENWQKAVGGYQQWSHSNVRVEDGRVVMEITVEANDYYNFDRGKDDLATGTPDETNGRFAELGWAKPFESNGSLTRTVSWEVGQPPETATVTESSGPQRNPSREDRIDNQDSGNGPLRPDNNPNTGARHDK